MAWYILTVDSYHTYYEISIWLTWVSHQYKLIKIDSDTTPIRISNVIHLLHVWLLFSCILILWANQIYFLYCGYYILVPEGPRSVFKWWDTSCVDRNCILNTVDGVLVPTLGWCDVSCMSWSNVCNYVGRVPVNVKSGWELR